MSTKQTSATFALLPTSVIFVEIKPHEIFWHLRSIWIQYIFGNLVHVFIHFSGLLGIPWQSWSLLWCCKWRKQEVVFDIVKERIFPFQEIKELPVSMKLPVQWNPLKVLREPYRQLHNLVLVSFRYLWMFLSVDEDLNVFIFIRIVATSNFLNSIFFITSSVVYILFLGMRYKYNTYCQFYGYE